MVTPPVDFAIIAALKVEREAMVRRFADVKKIQDSGEPLTYYAGKLEIPGEDRPYLVVVTQLIEMGNPDAAIVTTKVIQRWQPRNILMVGIAGGVKGKAALGDVVVSLYAHYSEPGKRKPMEVEHRDRQFNSDLMLYARAQHYDAAEWMSEIDVPRPGAGKLKSPKVRFGPIACGEEVIADGGALAELQCRCPKMVAVAMEGAGVAKAVLSDSSPPRYLEIRGISDYAGPKKNDGWHDYAANAAAAFTIGFLRSHPIPPEATPKQAAGKANAAPTLVIIAQSLRPVASEELIPVLGPDTKLGELEFLHLDFTDLVKSNAVTHPQVAAERVASPQGKLLAALAKHANARLVFGGLAAIPPVVLAGHVITARRHVSLFDFHERDWAWPGTSQTFPKLQRSGFPKQPVKRPGVAFIRMAVSYPVTKADTDPLGLETRMQIDLSLDAPVRFIVKSEEQVLDYGRAFRATLDELRTAMPYCERVHLFYAGPMALAFHLGQQISENIHPPVTVWNFRRGYEWGLDLAAAVTDEPCIIRPPALSKAIAPEEK
jgi:nucleoside phosphorylase